MKNLTFFRYFSYAVLLLLLCILQSTPRLIPEILGSKPLLLMPLAFSISAFEGKVPSLIFGALCGVFTDLATGGYIGFFALILTAVCYLEAHLFEKYFVSRFTTVIVFAVVSITLIICVYFVFFTIFGGVSDWQIHFVNHYLSRIIYTIAITVPIYFVTRFLSVL